MLLLNTCILGLGMVNELGSIALLSCKQPKGPLQYTLYVLNSIYTHLFTDRFLQYPEEIPALMQEFFDWQAKIQKERGIHPILIAAKICYVLLHIHPFYDGNGRMARIVMAMVNMLRDKDGYAPVVFHQFDHSEYVEAMYRAQHAGAPDDFYCMVIDSLARFYTNTYGLFDE
jgi:fido (protein-threonine AMPylation protein)